MFLLHFDNDAKGSGILSLISSMVYATALYPLSGLTAYHCFLTMSSMTTNEDIKDTFLVAKDQSFELVENPYSFGSPILNIWYTMCSPYPPTRLSEHKK